ncbi:hypothetical protein G3G77_004956 [Salmonella enterica]|nr:hypothetical protein [Salmonella enterica]EEH5466720.1 hypothetical protein [Salmonella enterica]EEH7556189.1 hypothetical protein [Salmonella enterica]EEO5640371.1 hypothetical protein [Salmonella enterica]EEQ0204554.1 hypothetical protein [Salmonella enterica]
MKKYTLPLCGLAISLGMVSSAMAAAVTGSQTISGTLTAPTCTVSIPADFNMPNTTVSLINSKISTGLIQDSAITVGAVSILNCGNQTISASTVNSAGISPTNSLMGRFKYDNAPGSVWTEEPLAFRLKTFDKTGAAKDFGLGGSNHPGLENGDTVAVAFYKGPASTVASKFIGNYSSDVTFTFNYS